MRIFRGLFLAGFELFENSQRVGGCQGRARRETRQWKQEPEQNFWVNGYTDARSAKKRLDEEYAEYKSILTELGPAKIK